MDNFNLKKYLAESKLLKEGKTYQFSEYDFDITKEPGYQEEVIKQIKLIHPDIEDDIMVKLIGNVEDYHYGEARKENKKGRDYKLINSDEFADSVIMNYKDQYLAENKLNEVDAEEVEYMGASMFFDELHTNMVDFLKSNINTDYLGNVDELATDVVDLIANRTNKNDLTENKGLDLAKDVISKAREAMKKLTDEEVEAFRKEVANAFDLK